MCVDGRKNASENGWKKGGRLVRNIVKKFLR